MAKKLFDKDVPVGVTTTGIIHGKTSGVINLNGIKYKWAYNLWEQMLANTWFPKEADLTTDAKHYKLLLNSEKFMYDRVLSQLIFMDGVQTNNSTDNINPWITAPEVNMCIVRQGMEEALHCYVEGTEILTNNGFMDFREINKDTLIANYHENGDIDFTKPTEIISGNHTGEIISFKGQRYNLSVTPNHRMVRLNTRNGNKFEVELASEISLHNHKAPVSGYIKSSINKFFSPEDRLKVAFQADGTIANNGNITENGTMFKFYLKKERKIKRLKKIIKDGSFKHTITDMPDGFKNIYIWANEPMDKEFNWIKLNELSVSWCLEFLEELTYWDGSRSGGLLRYSNTNKEAINKVMSVVAISGLRVGIDKTMTTGFNGEDLGNRSKEYWTLNFVDTDYVSGRSISKTTNYYNGQIYCVTVPSSFVIVRYKDKVAVSGNSQSYAVMVDTISANTDEIYEMWRRDEHLFNKNKHILDSYETYSAIAEEDDTAKLYMLTANICLEGIYFYSGFAAMYALARASKMIGSSQMIKFIQRDEATHLSLYSNTFKTIKNEFPHLMTPEAIAHIRNMFKEAVDLEISWGKYITKDGILGLSPDLIEQFIKYLANKRLSDLGLEVLYPEIGLASSNNPLPWFDSFSSFNEQRTNFFEGTVTNYSQNSLDLNF